MFNEIIDLTCDSSGQECLPTVIADEYWIKVLQSTTISIGDSGPGDEART